MQFLRAGQQQLILLELESELLGGLAKQAGFAFTVEDSSRHLLAEINPDGWKDPLLLFDAADPANIGWFSRCQFYVDGRTGNVLQTPLAIANCRDRDGRVQQSLRISIAKELPAGYQVPGQHAVNEQVVYGLFYNLLKALRTTGVAVCGGSVVTPLVGRVERPPSRN